MLLRSPGRTRISPRCSWQSLKSPFAVYILNEERVFAVASLAAKINVNACVDALQAYEPDVPWMRDFLVRRMQWYEGAHDPRAVAARKDLEEFLKYEPARIVDMTRGTGK